MHAKGLTTTVLAAALFAALVALALASEDAPGSSGNSADHASTGTAEPPSVTVLNTHEVEGILGRPVLGAADENMGSIVDVIVDRSGRVRAAVIDFGGFFRGGRRHNPARFTPFPLPPPRHPNPNI